MKIYYIFFSQLKCVVEDCKDIYYVNKYHTIKYVFTHSLIYKLLDIVTCIHLFLFVCLCVLLLLFGGRHEKCWDISCEKSRFYAKKSYFFQF
jgi:hypothetical protein